MPVYHMLRCRAPTIRRRRAAHRNGGGRHSLLSTAFEDPLKGNLAGLHGTQRAQALTRGVREKGIRVIPWTVKDVASMERLLELGVHGIITDRPDLLLDLCRRRGIEIGRESLKRP